MCLVMVDEALELYGNFSSSPPLAYVVKVFEGARTLPELSASSKIEIISGLE